MTRFLITGASGFVAQPLINRLTTAGHSVTAVVRREDTSLEVPTINVGEIHGQTDWQDALKGQDIVIHLAARTHVLNDRSADAEAAYRALNLEGTKALATQAAACGIKRLVFLSSVKVNGEETPIDAPFRADDPPKPEDAYGRTKWLAERALRDIEKETSMEVSILRPPLVYGPGVKGNMLKLLGLASRGWPLPLGGLRNKRSLIHVDNLATALVLAAEHHDAAGKTYLISDGEDVSTPDLVTHLAAGLGVSATLLPIPDRALKLALSMTGQAGMYRRLAGSLVVDSTPIRRELGWTPLVSMVQGLEQTAAWYAKTNGGSG